jgi:hypothetical protein
LAVGVALTSSVRAAGTFPVTSTADTGPGSLRQAITDANAAGGGTINITSGGLIGLNSPLPIITGPTTVNGNNVLVSGNNQHRVFFVDAPPGAAVTFNNLIVLNGKAKGGDGGADGGGGGLGAGGGLFVGRGNVTVSNVTFTGNAAVGGKGGNITGSSPGGGGGLGGNGGGNNGGGGGFLGAGGYGGASSPPAPPGAGGGGGMITPGESSVSGGGRGGGVGGVGAPFGGGGGNVGAGGGGGTPAEPGGNAALLVGGNGNRFGGGGGSLEVAGSGGDYGGGGGGSARGGAGGFGGGGGAGGGVIGGNGGFGGGGGGAGVSNAHGFGGAFAGDGAAGSTGSGGGGGAALGAHVFVRSGAGTSLTVADTSADNGLLDPGDAGGTRAGPGYADGSAFFLAGPTTFSVSANQTRTIAGSIADVAGFVAHPTAAGFAPATLTKTGPGALALDYPNAYTGGTVVAQGTITSGVVSVSAIVGGTLTFNDTTTGPANTTFVASCLTFANPIVVADAGTGQSTLASAAAAGAFGPTVFTGGITLHKSLTVLAQNANPLNALHDPGQTRFDGTISGPGGLTIAGGNMVQFRTGAKTYTGTTAVTANSTLSLYDGASTPANSAVHIDAGSTVVLEGLSSGAFANLAGAGTLANNPSYFQSFLAVGSDNTDTAFTGQVTGRVRLSKVGAGTLSLGPRDNANFVLTVSAGRVRLTGDQRLESLFVDTAAPGTQALDLAGHTVRIFTGGMQGIALESSLNRRVGTAADGIYDSTAPSHPRSQIGIAFDGGGQPLRMKLTLAGDANLDGLVNFTDLVALAQNYNGGEFSAFWDEGDFTYDQKVSFDDLVLLAQNYNGSFLPAAPIPGAPADFARDLAAAFADTPEPASVAGLAVYGLTAFQRRRRRRPSAS